MRIKLLLIVCALLPRFQSLIEKPNALMLPMRQKYMDEKMHHVECACRDPLKGAVLGSAYLFGARPCPQNNQFDHL